MSSTKTTNKGAKKSNALSVKRLQRAKRPVFKRHAPHRKPSLLNNNHWKKPRGLHNKQKDHKTGSASRVSDGWRTPVEVRGLHISGRTMVRVETLAQLNGIDAATSGIVIGAVGGKRQLEILEACKTKGLHVLNHKMDDRITLLKKRREEQTTAIAQSRSEKEKKHKEAESKASKKKAEEKISDEDHKEEENKIKEEVLTGKGQ